MTILYEVFTIKVDEDYQYQYFVPVEYFNNREMAIDYCKRGNMYNNDTEFYWKELYID